MASLREKLGLKSVDKKKEEDKEQWSVNDFEKNRPELCDFCKVIIENLQKSSVKTILVRAPVKSGKRQMCEYLSIRDRKIENNNIKHIFISAFHRVSDEEQRLEIKSYGLKVYSINTKEKVEEFMKDISPCLKKGEHFVFHVDECDYGSGHKSILKQVWDYISDLGNSKRILYSATPAEVLKSPGFLEDLEIEEKGHVYLEYKPPRGYCGSKKFLKKGLVKNAVPIFEKDKEGKFKFSSQGEEIIQSLSSNVQKGNNRNILVLRLTGEDSSTGEDSTSKKERKHFYTFLNNIDNFPDLKSFIDNDELTIIVDKNEQANGLKSCKNYEVGKIRWDSKKYWSKLSTKIMIICVVDQTSSRSTEWACHDRVDSYHDYRENSIYYNTVSQAQERINHYKKKYGGFQPITMYGHVPTWKFSAGEIKEEQYLNPEYMVKKVSKKELYTIIHVETKERHKDYTYEMSEDECDKAVQSLGLQKTFLSSRVKGNINDKKVFDSKFFGCDDTNWDSVWRKFQEECKDESLKKALDKKESRNPFNKKALSRRHEDGKWEGYHRDWKVYDYDKDIKGDAGWGVEENYRLVICYKQGKLGVGISWYVRSIIVDSLQSHKSQYG